MSYRVTTGTYNTSDFRVVKEYARKGNLIRWIKEQRPECDANALFEQGSFNVGSTHYDIKVWF